MGSSTRLIPAPETCHRWIRKDGNRKPGRLYGLLEEQNAEEHAERSSGICPMDNIHQTEYGARGRHEWPLSTHDRPGFTLVQCSAARFKDQRSKGPGSLHLLLDPWAQESESAYSRHLSPTFHRCNASVHPFDHAVDQERSRLPLGLPSCQIRSRSSNVP